MICNYCGCDFEPSHFNQRLCSAECKSLAIKRAKSKYKKTEKGEVSKSKWVASERRKENEKKYRSTPQRRHALVLAQMNYLKCNEAARERKRMRDRLYGASERGRDVNRAAAAKYRKSENGALVRRVVKARRRGAYGGFTNQEWIEKLNEYSGKCAHCGTTERIEIDHIKPIAMGGTNTIDNIQPLCRSCNARKGDSYAG